MAVQERETFEQVNVDANRAVWDGKQYVHKHNGQPHERLNLLWQGWEQRSKLQTLVSQLPPKTWEGCRACYGSGGKRVAPCQVCNGTGKLPKGDTEMKRIFCDCCGEEFKYDETVATVSGSQREGSVHGKHAPVNYVANLTIKPVKPAHSGESIDFCTDCRWKVIDMLDPRPQQVERVRPTKLDAGHIENIFKRHSKSFAGNYELTPGQAAGVYKDLFLAITGDKP